MLFYTTEAYFIECVCYLNVCIECSLAVALTCVEEERRAYVTTHLPFVALFIQPGRVEEKEGLTVTDTLEQGEAHAARWLKLHPPHALLQKGSQHADSVHGDAVIHLSRIPRETSRLC